MPELKLAIERSPKFLIASQFVLLSTGGFCRKSTSKHRELMGYFETRAGQNFPMVHLGALFWFISDGMFCENLYIAMIFNWKKKDNFCFSLTFYGILNNSNQNESLWLQFWQCHKPQSPCGHTGCLPPQQRHETSVKVWPRTPFRKKKKTFSLDLQICSGGEFPQALVSFSSD